MPNSGRLPARRAIAAPALLTCLAFTIGGCAARYEESLHRDLTAARDRLAEPGETRAPAPDGPLESYVVYAMAQSPELLAGYQRWRAASLRISSARRLPEPMVMYAFYALPVQTRVGPQRHRVSAEQSFPWPTRLTAGADAQSARARAAQRRFEAQALALARRVADAWWALWFVRQAQDVEREQLEILDGLSESLRARVETSQAGLADLAQVDLTRSRVDDRIAELGDPVIDAGARQVHLREVGEPGLARLDTGPKRLGQAIEDLELLALDVLRLPHEPERPPRVRDPTRERERLRLEPPLGRPSARRLRVRPGRQARGPREALLRADPVPLWSDAGLHGERVERVHHHRLGQAASARDAQGGRSPALVAGEELGALGHRVDYVALEGPIRRRSARLPGLGEAVPGRSEVAMQRLLVARRATSDGEGEAREQRRSRDCAASRETTGVRHVLAPGCDWRARGRVTSSVATGRVVAAPR